MYAPPIMPAAGESIPAVDEAVDGLREGSAMSWESPSRFGRLGLVYRNLLRRALRPYEIRRRAVDESLATALEELDERVSLARIGCRPAIWADDCRPPDRPLPPLRELLAEGRSARLKVITSGVEALAAFGEPQARLLRELGVRDISERVARDELPIPTSCDRQGYGGDDHVAYWLSGLGDFLLLARIAEDRGRAFRQRSRVLDLGCSTGRLLRHFHTAGLGLELLGVDIAVVHVEWARRHLPADISVAQVSVLPALPFEDASLDVIYAGSVFTHVSDFEEALLLELRRVLHPDGFALVTVHSERLWDELCVSPESWMRRELVETRHRAEPVWVEPVSDTFFAGPMPAERLVLRNVAVRGHHLTQVIHSDRWLRERWGRLFDVERVERAMHGPHQDGLVLSRRR
jgi:SAM-dependent methyltransferase